MKRNRRWTLPAIVILLPFFAQPALGQTRQFWPKIDIFFKVDPNVRLYFSAGRTAEHGEHTGSDLEASVDFHFKRLARLNKASRASQDESKGKLVLLRAGFRYLTSQQRPAESRIAFDASPRVPLKAGVILSSRNRVELRFIDGESSWRFRNRLTIERAFAIRTYDIATYVRAESYYDGVYKKWSRTALTAGCVFPIQKHSEIEAYYEHQNRTETSPNRQVNALGVQLNLHF